MQQKKTFLFSLQSLVVLSQMPDCPKQRLPDWQVVDRTLLPKPYTLLIRFTTAIQSSLFAAVRQKHQLMQSEFWQSTQRRLPLLML